MCSLLSMSGWTRARGRFLDEDQTLVPGTEVIPSVNYLSKNRNYIVAMVISPRPDFIPRDGLLVLV